MSPAVLRKHAIETGIGDWAPAREMGRDDRPRSLPGRLRLLRCIIG
jgi:hypothetical protein